MDVDPPGRFKAVLRGAGTGVKRLTAIEFEQLKTGAAVLSRDEHGEKVLQTPDGRIIKLFRRKRLLSSALWSPYARRFYRAAQELSRRGVPSIEAIDLFRVPSIKRDAVVYRRLEGIELREALRNEPARLDELLERLAKFLALLHRRGVYFRAIHMGNVLVRPDGSLALIDVSEAQFRRQSLATPLRIRNFAPLGHYDVDAAAINRFGVDRFISAYLDEARSEQSLRPRFMEAAGKMLRRPPHRKAGD